jgi:hypothetical protein
MELYFLDDAIIAAAPSDSRAGDERIETRDRERGAGKRKPFAR